MILKPLESFYSVSIQCEKQQINQFYGKKPIQYKFENYPYTLQQGVHSCLVPLC